MYMAKIVVLGAGVAGHTASMLIRKLLGKEHTVTVVAPNANYQWIPSNIWVGVGHMTQKQVQFPLAPVYARKGIFYHQALAKAIHPEGTGSDPQSYVEVAYGDADRQDKTARIPYDFLVNATGPKLDFEATPGLGPKGHTLSVCTTSHAEETWKSLQESFRRLEAGKEIRYVIGVGHPNSTCQGAAFEYILNVATELERRGLRNRARITWLTNEYELGDFGMGGAYIKRGGYITSTRVFAESFFTERGIRWIKRAGVRRVEPGVIHYETLSGEVQTIPFDFAMLIPAFAGVGLKAFDRNGEDITNEVFTPNAFMKVDADYKAKPFEEWSVRDWPSTYQSPKYANLFAAGIAFAPPHPIAKPMKSPSGLAIFPTPPRTGMPCGVIGMIVAENIAHSVKKGKISLPHKASMGRMGAACVVSAGYGILDGMAATMTVSPIVPDFERFPEWGRDISTTMGEPGLAGHWIKLFLHHMFLYKAKGLPGWSWIPE
jgi:sulfide:quinone oxidoreductase